MTARRNITSVKQVFRQTQNENQQTTDNRKINSKKKTQKILKKLKAIKYQ